MTTDDPSAIRRDDRAIENDGEIREFLRRSQSGVLATVADGQPFLTPLIFVYDADEHALFVHTSPHGRTPANVAADERVCFNANEMGRILPDWKAWEFSNEYESVTVFGRARILEDEDAQRDALQGLMAKYAPHMDPGEDYRAITDGEIERTAVVRVDVDHWSGKRKTADEEFPGAYEFEDVQEAVSGDGCGSP